MGVAEAARGAEVGTGRGAQTGLTGKGTSNA